MSTSRQPHATDGGDLDVVVEQRLRRADQRSTTARQSLVSVLAAATAPLTLPEILEGDAALAQSSAYRNLAVLEQAEVVRRVVTGDDHTRYELAEDLTGHHHHLVCSVCGRVLDFVLDDAAERALDDAIGVAAVAAGFTIDQHQLDLIGKCRQCR